MATQSPFSWLQDFIQNVASRAQPPAWVVDEAQRRVLLLLNHVLMQEKEATSRLLRQKGRVVLLQWREWNFKVQATPAGLLDRAGEEARADLTLTLTDSSPVTLVQAALRGEKPALRIEGDVQLAAEINWLADHVRWDVEEDLARILGDAPAHTLVQAVQRAVATLREFVASRATGPRAGASE
jgi:ubiquinone biosynthesis accessory factor UbiJ